MKAKGNLFRECKACGEKHLRGNFPRDPIGRRGTICPGCLEARRLTVAAKAVPKPRAKPEDIPSHIVDERHRVQREQDFARLAANTAEVMGR